MQYNQPYGGIANAPYINGNPSTGVQGSIPPAASIEYPQREIVGVLTDCGFTPTNSDLAQLAKAVQSGKLIYGLDTGSADALAVALARAPDAYTAGMRFSVKKIASPNATTTPTVNFNALGAKTIVDRRGNALAIGDLTSGAILDLEYDGTNMRMLGIVSSDIAAVGSLRNVKQFSTSGRVSMAGNAGNSYTVTAWSPGSYVKQSATSTLLIWATFPTLTNSGSGSGQGSLSIGGTLLAFIPANNTTSLSIGEGTIVQAITGIGAGSLALSLAFLRTDSVSWTGILCFNGPSDGGGFPTTTTATIVIGEIGL